MAWVLWTVPLITMNVAAFRPDRNPEITQALTDLGLLLFFTAVAPFLIQNVTIGVANLRDRSPTRRCCPAGSDTRTCRREPPSCLRRTEQPDGPPDVCTSMNSLEQMLPADSRTGRGQATYDFAAVIPLWTVAQVATTLRVSRMTIYRMVHSGELDHVRIGHTFRVPEAEVRRILQSRGTVTHRDQLT